MKRPPFGRRTAARQGVSEGARGESLDLGFGCVFHHAEPSARTVGYEHRQTLKRCARSARSSTLQMVPPTTTDPEEPIVSVAYAGSTST